MGQEVADILYRAADLLEPEGAWTQGAMGRTAVGRVNVCWGSLTTCWCALGAIRNVSFPLSDKYEREAGGLLADQVGGDVPSWNDAPERTQSEVVAKLREAAAIARAQGKAF